MPNFEYIDTLPNLSQDLISEIYSTTNSSNFWLNKESSVYSVYPGNEKIYEFVRSCFTEKHIASVQVITNTLGPHKDKGRSIVYNYIVDCGGEDIFTTFYDIDESGNYVEIESHKIEPYRWHKLNVSTYHSVSTIPKNNKRISLSVYLRDADNPFL